MPHRNARGARAKSLTEPIYQRAPGTRHSSAGLPEPSRLDAGWPIDTARQGFVWVAGGFEPPGRSWVALRPTYYFGYLYGAMNAVELGHIEEAHDFIRQARVVQPDRSFALAHRGLGAMAPDVDRRISAALRKAGLE